MVEVLPEELPEVQSLINPDTQPVILGSDDFRQLINRGLFTEKVQDWKLPFCIKGVPLYN